MGLGQGMDGFAGARHRIHRRSNRQGVVRVAQHCSFGLSVQDGLGMGGPEGGLASPLPPLWTCVGEPCLGTGGGKRAQVRWAPQEAPQQDLAADWLCRAELRKWNS